jgi:hypothetical protein
MIGSECYRLIVADNGRFESSHLLQYLPTIEVGIGMIAFARNDLLESGERLVKAAELLERQSAAEMRELKEKAVGGEFDRFVVACDGRLVLRQLTQDVATIDVGIDMVDLQLDRALIADQRIIEALQFLEHGAAIVVRQMIQRIQSVCLLVAGQRFIPAA